VEVCVWDDWGIVALSHEWIILLVPKLGAKRIGWLELSFSPGADPARKFGSAISEIFRSQVSLRVHYCKRDEVYFTALLWQNNGRQNGLISRTFFSELYKILVNKVSFVSFRGSDRPNRPPCFAITYVRLFRSRSWWVGLLYLFFLCWVQLASLRVAFIRQYNRQISHSRLLTNVFHIELSYIFASFTSMAWMQWFWKSCLNFSHLKLSTGDLIVKATRIANKKIIKMNARFCKTNCFVSICEPRNYFKRMQHSYCIKQSNISFFTKFFFFFWS